MIPLSGGHCSNNDSFTSHCKTALSHVVYLTNILWQLLHTKRDVESCTWSLALYFFWRRNTGGALTISKCSLRHKILVCIAVCEPLEPILWTTSGPRSRLWESLTYTYKQRNILTKLCSILKILLITVTYLLQLKGWGQRKNSISKCILNYEWKCNVAKP